MVGKVLLPQREMGGVRLAMPGDQLFMSTSWLSSNRQMWFYLFLLECHVVAGCWEICGKVSSPTHCAGGCFGTLIKVAT